ncbi:hypothetical protein GOP47_0029930 [Adiantum capillus-veneris]|nr:hypothetical protein GOP47_0029930 [Adiantum capillus-veneris]
MACSTLPSRVLYPNSRGGGRGAWLHGRRAPKHLPVKAVSAPEDCNEEDCAPEKEVGKVSMEWKASESTKVLGTFPPLSKKKWTGYVEKDTAGQTNIYAVEPTVYVSENVISSNTAGDSSEGSEQTLIVAVGLALGLLVGAGVVLLTVSVSSPPPPPVDTANLSYYIQRFTPVIATPELPQSPQELVPSQSETPPMGEAPVSSTDNILVEQPGVAATEL